MNFDAILLATITCFSTLLGGTFATRRRKSIGVLGAFAAGVLITTSLLIFARADSELGKRVAKGLKL
jgi:hypothetical protein